jgi:hypothetical protein
MASKKVTKGSSYNKWESDTALRMIIDVANADLPPYSQIESLEVPFSEAVRRSGSEEFFNWVFNAEFLETYVQPAPWNSWSRYQIALTWQDSLRSLVKGKPAFAKVAYIFNGEGKTHFDDFLLRVLTGRDVSGRLRECPICNDIYWAWRYHAKQCGKPRCKTRLSSKTFYEKEENKERIRQYYQAKKKRAKKVPKH